MTDSDQSQEPTRDELETRVEQLEQTVQQMLPSRRDALKLGGTALAAGALGSAASGSASAGTQSVGTIGSASSPVDVEVEDINPNSTRAVNYNNNEITNVSSLSTEQVDTSNGYSWTEVTGSRSFDTEETAPADRDIWFVMSAVSSADGTNIEFNVLIGGPGSIHYETENDRDNGNVLGIPMLRVPAGTTYEVGAFGDTANYSIRNWSELR